MTVRVLTTCHTQYTWDSSICNFLFNRTTHQVFVTYLTGALYVHPLWLYKHQHDNRVRSKLSAVMVPMAVLIRNFSSGIHTHPVSWNCAYHLRMELLDGGCFPNLVRNCRWTVVTDRHSWNVSSQNAFSLPFAAILVNCAPSGEMRNYCIPHIIKQTFENFLVHRCKYVLLSQMYCVWQVVKTPTVISNNPVVSYTRVVRIIRY